MIQKLVAFGCLIMAVPSVVPLPAGLDATSADSDLGNYTVLYDGPSGKHVQFGEPGKAVKGFYTFLDSRGKKQKVTYEADERGYRVKATVAVDENDNPIDPFLRSAAISSQSKPNLTTQPQPQTTERLQTTRQQTKIVGTGLPIIPIKPPTGSPVVTNSVRSGTGKITFKAPRSQTFSNMGFNLGYPYIPGNYIYAL